MRGWPRSRDLPLLVTLTAALMLAHKVRQFLQYQIGFELADYETVLWNTLHGRFLAMTCGSASFLALERDRTALFVLLLALAATVKEDAFVAIAGIGVFLALSGRRARGIAVALAAAAGLVLVMGGVLPHFRGQAPGSEYRFASYW